MFTAWAQICLDQLTIYKKKCDCSIWRCKKIWGIFYNHKKLSVKQAGEKRNHLREAAKKSVFFVALSNLVAIDIFFRLKIAENGFWQQ